MRHFDVDYEFKHISDAYFNERDQLHQQLRDNHHLLESVKLLNDFCDKDPRQPYYDIKKHKNGSVYLTIRTQKFLPIDPGKHWYQRESRKSKKFFGKTRHDVTIAAAQYMKSGQF